MNKDLRILSKEKKEELLAAKCYLDISPSSMEKTLIVDLKLPEKLLINQDDSGATAKFDSGNFTEKGKE